MCFIYFDTLTLIEFGFQVQSRRDGYGSVASTSIVETPEAEIASSRNSLSLLRLLHKCFGVQFYAVGVLRFIGDCSGFMGPILLNKLVGFIEDRKEPVSFGYLYAGLLFLSTLIGEIIDNVIHSTKISKFEQKSSRMKNRVSDSHGKIQNSVQRI